jgi:4-amino-4-deoxy-L-arabinose transferase-like glycosyltransferase
MGKLKFIIFILVVILGIILKLNNYSIYPQRGATSDEYSYSFQGVSLLTKGIPISWSSFPQYKNLRNLTIDHIYFPIVYPYFDHTPLNGIITGAWALVFGENTFEKIQLNIIRIVPIIFSTISSVLLFLICIKLFNYKTAIWALLIYVTTTIFVIQGRVVLAENLITPLLLGSIYAFFHFYKKIDIKKTLFLGTMCGLTFWAKELGIVGFLSLLYLFISEKIKPKYIYFFICSFLFFILLYIAYGTYFDADIFWKILSQQSERNVGPDTLPYILSRPIIINKFYNDGWYFLGFFAIFSSFFSYEKNKFVIIPAAIYLLLLLSALTQKGEMGWYIIPLFPFMSILTARFLLEQTKKIGFGIFPMLLFVGIYFLRYVYEANFGLTPIQFRIGLFIFFVPNILTVIFNKKKTYRFLANFWFYFFIVANILITYSYIHPA